MREKIIRDQITGVFCPTTSHFLAIALPGSIRGGFPRSFQEKREDEMLPSLSRSKRCLGVKVKKNLQGVSGFEGGGSPPPATVNAELAQLA
jgi:hypothetical protein